MLSRAFGTTNLTEQAWFGKKEFGRIVWLLFAFLMVLWPEVSADGASNKPNPLRTNEPIYQNPFDLAAGGASLTRATQEGVVFANPSLSAFGEGFLRWVYMRTGVHLGAAAVDLALDVAKGGGSSKVDAQLVQRALKTPVFAGFDFAAGVLLANAGLGVFGSARVDLEGRQFGSQGLPELRARAFGYGGGVGTSAVQVGDWLALGTAVRYQANGEVYKTLGVSEIQQGSTFLTKAVKEVERGYGLGVDAGVTLQKRTRNFDVRLATTVDDIGDTKFTGNLPSWKQTVNSGVGFTVHNRYDALHCAFDQRDLMRSYGEHWTRRTYAGCKALLRGRIGIGAGLYQGWPTWGGVLNLLFLRVEGGSYTKEMGKQAGTLGRRVYFVAIGADIP